MARLVREGEHAVVLSGKGHAKDMTIIGLVQRMQQFAIDGYQTASEHAADLGRTKVIELLNKTIEAKRTGKFSLNELAQNIINDQALNPKSAFRHKKRKEKGASLAQDGGFYVPEGGFGPRNSQKKPKNMDVSRYIDEGNPNIQET